MTESPSTNTGPRSEPLLTLENVSFRYPSDNHGRDIIRDLTLSISRGDVLGIRGRNGSGKTTLLRLIAGHLSPTAGRYIQHTKELRVVYLNQHASECVAPALTVQEQLLVGIGNNAAVFLSTTSHALAAELDRQVNQYGIGLADRLNAFTSELSGGQRQVVALLSTLCARADILLLDEYTSFMDDMTASMSKRLLHDVIKSGDLSIVMVDHANEFILPGDNIIVLEGHA